MPSIKEIWNIICRRWGNGIRVDFKAENIYRSTSVIFISIIHWIGVLQIGVLFKIMAYRNFPSSIYILFCAIIVHFDNAMNKTRLTRVCSKSLCQPLPIVRPRRTASAPSRSTNASSASARPGKRPQVARRTRTWSATTSAPRRNASSVRTDTSPTRRRRNRTAARRKLGLSWRSTTGCRTRGCRICRNIRWRRTKAKLARRRCGHFRALCPLTWSPMILPNRTTDHCACVFVCACLSNNFSPLSSWEQSWFRFRWKMKHWTFVFIFLETS